VDLNVNVAIINGFLETPKKHQLFVLNANLLIGIGRGENEEKK